MSTNAEPSLIGMTQCGIEDVDPGILPEKIAKLQKELRDLIASDEFNKPMERQITLALLQARAR